MTQNTHVVQFRDRFGYSQNLAVCATREAAKTFVENLVTTKGDKLVEWLLSGTEAVVNEFFGEHRDIDQVIYTITEFPLIG